MAPVLGRLGGALGLGVKVLGGCWGGVCALLRRNPLSPQTLLGMTLVEAKGRFWIARPLVRGFLEFRRRSCEFSSGGRV